MPASPGGDCGKTFAAIGLAAGYEFHYSRLENAMPIETAFKVRRGTGTGGERDGLIYNKTVASYLQVHVLGTPEWAAGLVSAAANYRQHRMKI